MRHIARAVVIAAALLCTAPAGAAELQVVEPDKLTLTGSNDTGSVWLRNTSGETVTPTFTAVGENDDGDTVPDRMGEVRSDEKSVEPGAVQRFDVLVRGDASGGFTGQLVATSDVTGVVAGTVDATVSESPLLASTSVETALFVPLAVAFIFVAFWGMRALGQDRAGKKVVLGSPLPGADWGKSSYASTLTAGGALLATVVAAGVLPDPTVTLSKTAYTALALIFGILVAVAGLVYGAFTTEDDAGEPAGFVGTYLAAAWVTTWATLGQLYVLFLLVGELSADKGFSDAPRIVMQVAVALTAVVVVIYTRRIKTTILEVPPTKETTKAKVADKLEAMRGQSFDVGAVSAAAAEAVPDVAAPRRISLL